MNAHGFSPSIPGKHIVVKMILHLYGHKFLCFSRPHWKYLTISPLRSSAINLDCLATNKRGLLWSPHPKILTAVCVTSRKLPRQQLCPPSDRRAAGEFSHWPHHYPCPRNSCYGTVLWRLKKVFSFQRWSKDLTIGILDAETGKDHLTI